MKERETRFRRGSLFLAAGVDYYYSRSLDKKDAHGIKKSIDTKNNLCYS